MKPVVTLSSAARHGAPAGDTSKKLSEMSLLVRRFIHLEPDNRIFRASGDDGERLGLGVGLQG